MHRKAFIVLSLLALAWAAPIPSRALDPLKDDGAARIARMPHTSIQKAEEDKPIIVRRRKLIQFTEPPIGEPRESARLPPPLVTFRSDPALRAKYPPNPNAPTVSQSLRQEFGQLVQFDYSLSGTDEDGLIRAASTEALLSLAIRVYFEDRMLQSIELLPKYLNQYGDRFIREAAVLNRKIVGGKPSFDLRLLADRDLLIRDLEEKKFIAAPKLRPIFYVFLEHDVNGQPEDQRQRGRRSLENLIRDNNLRFADQGTPSMADPNIDITRDQESFFAGRSASQRNSIEAALTGVMTSRVANLERPLSEDEWANDTLEQRVDIPAVGQGILARLPLPTLLGALDAALQQRKNANMLEWWDVQRFDVEAPIDSLSLTEEQRQAASQGAPPALSVSALEVGLKRNYYKPFYYVLTRSELKLVRIDNGEIIAEVFQIAPASGEDLDAAIESSVQRAADEAGDLLLQEYNAYWPKTVLDAADYKLLLCGLSGQDLDDVTAMLKGLHKTASVNIRAAAADVAVLTYDCPLDKTQLIKALTASGYPKFRLVSENKNALEFQRL